MRSRPAFGSVTKTLFYGWATFTYEDGSVVPGAASKGGRSAIARALTQGPVYARLDKADGDVQRQMRRLAAELLPAVRPHRHRSVHRALFRSRLRLEGTVRGTGGLRIVDDSCATTVPGLYAAGDAATRELICGGFTGGGSHNAAWAISSGTFAGQGAADYARHAGPTRGRRLSSARQLSRFASAPGDRFKPAELARAVQDEVFPYELNYFREAGRLGGSLERLDALWAEVSKADARQPLTTCFVPARAHPCWQRRAGCTAAALARQESRGMHRRDDFPIRTTASVTT